MEHLALTEKQRQSHAAASRRYRAKHPEKGREATRRWRAKSPEKSAEVAPRWRARHPQRYAMFLYTYNAKKRGLVFDLPREDFHKLLSAPCEYCGAPPNPVGGIDRVDNGRGYIVGNVVPCCKICNLAKRDMSRAEFLDWLMRAARHISETSTRMAGE